MNQWKIKKAKQMKWIIKLSAQLAPANFIECDDRPIIEATRSEEDSGRRLSSVLSCSLRIVWYCTDFLLETF